MKSFIEKMLEEKGIDIEQDIELEGHIGLTVQMVIDFACSMPKAVQAQVRNTLSRIDFMNGDVMHFINHMAKGMVESVQ